MRMGRIIAELRGIESMLESNINSAEYWENEAKRLEALCIKYKVPYRKPAKKKTFNK